MKASYTTCSLKMQASYPLNTMDMATSWLELKGMQKSSHCVYICEHEQVEIQKELRIVKTYSCTYRLLIVTNN